jgi:hypothetical protein
MGTNPFTKIARLKYVYIKVIKYREVKYFKFKEVTIP